MRTRSSSSERTIVPLGSVDAVVIGAVVVAAGMAGPASSGSVPDGPSSSSAGVAGSPRR
jgi:hypothetical protein